MNIITFSSRPDAGYLRCWLGGLLLLLLLSGPLAQAQFTIISTSPTANAKASPAMGPVSVTFNQTVTSGSTAALKVFSAQRGGLRTVGSGTTTASGSTVSFAPAYAFKPGETVQATVTTAAAAAAGGTLATARVLQFTTAVTGGLGTFSGGGDPAVGLQPTSVAVGDVDGDGDLDLLTSNGADNTVSVRLNNGLGGFSGGSNLTVRNSPEKVVLGDVDNDGDLDILVANFNSGTVSVRLNNGLGGFSGGSDPAVGTNPLSVVVGDVDGDGDLDLLTANDNNTVSVRLNNGLGGFGGGSDPAVGNLPYSVTVGDVDGDGDLDLLTANYSANTVSVRLNNGLGGFSGGSDVAVGTKPLSVVVGDVDGDGDLDLLTANNGASTVSVRLNNGLGGFSGGSDPAVGNAPRSVVLGDVDSDGDLDLLTANEGSNTVSVRLNNGSGVFGGGSDPGVGIQPTSVAVGDVDGDGDLDLLTANLNAYPIPANGTVSVRLNQNQNSPIPTLASITQSSGPVGTSVTLTGTNLTGALSVSFNGTVTSTFTSNNGIQLVLKVPVGATTGNVSVTTPNGTSNGVSFTVTASAPVISNFSPTFAHSGQSIVLNGTNLGGATALTFSGVAQTTFTVNAAGTQITAAVPYANMSSSPDLPSGVIQVTTPGGTATSATALRLLAVTAATDGSYPYGAAGESVAITGTGFAGATASFVLASVTYPVTYTVVSETQITAVVPDLSGSTAPGGAGGFVVTNTPGLSGANFEVRSAVVSSLSPNSGVAGTSVTVNGFNFLRGGGAAAITGLTFNGVAATNFLLLSDGQATAKVPAGATTGYVRTVGGSYPETYSKGILFTVALADLVVSTGTQLSPTPIPAGSYNSITITGTGNGVLAGNVSVASFFTVQPGGGLSDGCSIISGAGSFTLGAGSILGICNAAGISSSGATGSVQVTGTRSFSTAAQYGYTGTAAVTGNGLPSTVASLAINTAGNVTLTAPVAISVAVGVGGAGNLVLNGNALTLLSSAVGTALAVNSSTGVVVGTATVQRYIDPSVNAGPGYRHYSSPVSNTTVADLATAGFSTTLTTSYNTSATPGTTTPFPTVFGYDQARVTLANSYAPFDRGYVVPAAPYTALTVGQGYAVHIAGNQLVDFVGTLTTGDQAPLALSRVAGNPDAGWQLLGNPYPAPLDYARVAPNDRTGLDAAIYVYSSTGPYVGNYRSYVNGFGGNPVLPVAQGFFARVSTGQTSGSLTFRNSQRLTAPDATAFQRPTADARPLVQLELRGATGPADALYAYAQAGATPAFDTQFDATKLANPTGLNLSSTAASDEALAIDGRPVFTAATALALNVGVPAAGTYTLSAAALNNLPTGLGAYLRDAQTGQTVNLRTQPSYAFAVTAAQATALLTGRFTLQFAASALATTAGLTAAEVSLYPNPAHNAFAVKLPGVAGAATVQAELLNALGQVVRRQAAALPASGTTFTVETGELAAGVYTLRLQAGNTSFAKRVVLN